MTTQSKNGILRDICEGRVDEFKIDPDEILVEPGFNVRDFTLQENIDHLAKIKASLKENGQIQALLVETKDRKIYLRGGETRLRAIRELRSDGVEWPLVLVKKVDSADDDKRLIVSLVENSGKPFNAAEEAEAFGRLVKWSWTPERISKATGRTLGYVTQALELTNAPAEVKALVATGTATKAAAVQATRKGSQAVEDLKTRAKSAPKDKAGKAKPVARTKAKPAKQPVVELEKFATPTEIHLLIVNILYAEDADQF